MTTAAEAAEIVAFVREVIRDEGRKVTFTMKPKLAPDPAKPHKFSTDPADEIKVEANACFVPIASLSSLGMTGAKSQLWKSVEVVALVEPQPGVDFSDYDFILDGADKYTMSVAEKLKPADVVYLWYVGGSK